MTTWQPTTDPVAQLLAMLRKVRWREPLEGYQQHCLRECALWVHAGLVDNPLDPAVGTTPREIALANVCECVLAWVGQPQEHARIDRLQKAVMTYWRISDE